MSRNLNLQVWLADIDKMTGPLRQIMQGSSGLARVLRTSRDQAKELNQQQRNVTGEASAVEIVVRGRHEELDFGDAKPGEDTEHKITTTCTYYKLSVAAEPIVEIDLLNFVFIVDGEDLLAEHRTALGI